MCGFISGLLVLSRWSVCLSSCQNHTGDHSFAVSLEIRKCEIHLFCNIVLAILGPLHLHVNFRTGVSILGEKALGIFIGTVLNFDRNWKSIREVSPC